MQHATTKATNYSKVGSTFYFSSWVYEIRLCFTKKNYVGNEMIAIFTFLQHTKRNIFKSQKGCYFIVIRCVNDKHPIAG